MRLGRERAAGRPAPSAQGRRAEELACRRLTAAGLEPLARNYRWRGGEVDLVMRDGDTVVFVEVRYRTRDDYGGGAESVDAHKQRRLVATAEHFLSRHPDYRHRTCRFDVVAIGPGPDGEAVHWLKGAFDET